MSKHSLINLKEIFPETIDDIFAPWKEWFHGNGFFSRTTTPALNVVDEAKQYKVTIAAPGFEKGDFDIEVDNNVLTISATSESEHEEDKKKYRRKEYNYSGFSRSFTLPADVNGNAVEASYENGILILSLPKNEKALGQAEKKVEVK